MNIFDVLTLICGLALFLYGMDVMGNGLKKSAGSRLKDILGKMTSNPVKGFLLGLIVTSIIQSSSATTVMVVGFVNAGTMTLTQAVGVIMGANVGTAVTAWITGLSGLGDGGAAVSSILAWLKPSAWMPILALIGICLLMFAKKEKHKDIGTILLGFSVLMIGMETMSGAVSGLKESESFKNILIMFSNPILGVLAGTVLTAIIQSSSASVGILQSLTVTGAITYGTAIPIVMGQNIGTCVTAMISSAGATKNGKRAALVHLYFNIIGVVIVLSVFYLLNAIFKFSFVDKVIGTMDVALVHTLFKIISVALIGPFYKGLEKLAILSIRDKKGEEEANMLDERLLTTPSVAVSQAEQRAKEMAVISCSSLKRSLDLLTNYDSKAAQEIREIESKVDRFEDEIGTYLVKLSGKSMDEKDSHNITKLLHIIGDLERISDHAVNIVASAEEIDEKKIKFTPDAANEIQVLSSAINEILDIACVAFTENNVDVASLVEPLEQTVDHLKGQIKHNHILRLQRNECSVENGFVLSDLLTNCERVADHCSNIAGCVIEITRYDALAVHKYLEAVKSNNEVFDEKYKEYLKKYSL